MNDKQSMYALCIGVPALVILLCVISFNRYESWQEFQKEHNCKVTGKVASSVLYANKHSVYVPEKTIYLCDDGISYTK